MTSTTGAKESSHDEGGALSIGRTLEWHHALVPPLSRWRLMDGNEALASMRIVPSLQLGPWFVGTYDKKRYYLRLQKRNKNQASLLEKDWMTNDLHKTLETRIAIFSITTENIASGKGVGKRREAFGF